MGHPHSGELHLTQTLRPLDARRMSYTVTVSDPKTYIRACTNERIFMRHDGPLIERRAGRAQDSLDVERHEQINRAPDDV
jgi:hypothetical protein